MNTEIERASVDQDQDTTALASIGYGAGEHSFTRTLVAMLRKDAAPGTGLSKAAAANAEGVTS